MVGNEIASEYIPPQVSPMLRFSSEWITTHGHDVEAHNACERLLEFFWSVLTPAPLIMFEFCSRDE